MRVRHIDTTSLDKRDRLRERESEDETYLFHQLNREIDTEKREREQIERQTDREIKVRLRHIDTTSLDREIDIERERYREIESDGETYRYHQSR